MTEVGDRRLYSITPSEEGEKVFTYSTMADHDIVSLHESGNYQGLTIRARFPGRDDLRAYREFCQENGLTFQVQSLYPEKQQIVDTDGIEPHGLTSAQHEVLQTAHKRGYFETPRQITLEEIADELDVSVQAVSTRLRRALHALLENTIG